MLRNKYCLICDFIVEELRGTDEISLMELLEKSMLHLSHHFPGDVSWYILQVKTDLEERGLIKVYFTREREQFIKPTKKLKTFSSSEVPVVGQGYQTAEPDHKHPFDQERLNITRHLSTLS